MGWLLVGCTCQLADVVVFDDMVSASFHVLCESIQSLTVSATCRWLRCQVRCFVYMPRHTGTDFLNSWSSWFTMCHVVCISYSLLECALGLCQWKVDVAFGTCLDIVWYIYTHNHVCSVGVLFPCDRILFAPHTSKCMLDVYVVGYYWITLGVVVSCSTSIYV